MTDLTVHAVPDEVHRALCARAVRHGRSAEAEALVILQDSVRPDLPSQGEADLAAGLPAIARESGVTDEDIDALQAIIDENRAEARRLHRPFEFE